MNQALLKLNHHFLIPTPQLQDDRFVDTLVYICRHTKEGAWGFVVNQPLPNSVGALLADLDLPVSQQMMNTPAVDGGPVRIEAGFVLHTGQPDFKSSFVIAENVCLTTSKDILQHLAFGELSHYLLCMGHCSWSKGQLEAEVYAGDWYICPADLPTLFLTPFADRLAACYAKMGIKPERLAANLGYA
ncbi:putative transcriptional regulator [Moraxella cuniculi DSM 21768]|uniref:UPF0301 protein SAMN02745664_11110 n=1 Tax=Moraxella cuniculi DSM 21768 TaxID=1122245 RepID=A0A1N7F982_9GAMM|nr:YqgE/AlgH family protein [Moraxella cuniculi]OOS03589.1 hypothetical protein B0189_09510 [Moraxella cuniculi]SIR96893.1 putative transcriptional regulator [Moraxella cuniculi DSM 21768]